MAALQEGLERVQADHDKFDQRLSVLEVENADAKGAQAKPGPAAPPAKTPSLRVVHLSPDGTEQMQSSAETASALNGDDPEDTSPRPSIRVSGYAPTNARGKRTGPVTEHIETTMPDEAPNGGNAGPAIQAGAPRPSALDPEAKRAYDAALALVNQKQYTQALDAFAAFLVKWPDHPNADNATYWRGECYFAQGEYARAAEQFEGLIQRFPLGNKVPDALLKLGMSQEKLGNPQKAQAAFDRLTREFPRSEAARRIPSHTSPGDAPAPRREVNK